MNTIELITRIKGLTDAQRQAFLSACATRGKNKGYLKADDGSNVAWSVLAGALHHSRGASSSRLWLESDEDRELRGELEQVAKTTGLIQLI